MLKTAPVLHVYANKVAKMKTGCLNYLMCQVKLNLEWPEEYMGQTSVIDNHAKFGGPDDV